MTLNQLLAAIQRQLDDVHNGTRNGVPLPTDAAADVLTYTVAVWETPGDYGNEINAVRVNHDQRIVWLET